MSNGLSFRIFRHLRDMSLESHQLKAALLNRYRQLNDSSPAAAYLLSCVIGKLETDAERRLAEDSWASYTYAKQILHGPFPLGEPAIAAHTELSRLYYDNVLGKGRSGSLADYLQWRETRLEEGRSGDSSAWDIWFSAEFL